MRIPARFFSVVLGILVIFFSMSAPVWAQSNTPYDSLMPTDKGVQVNIATLSQGVMLGMLSSATCLLGGIDYFTPTHQCLSYNNKTGTYSYATSSNGGLLGLGAAGIAMTYNSPFHTSDYLQYLSSNFGIVKKANAQATNTGFDQLSPITNLWIAFRNLSYLLFVIIFIVIGFAVMLRAKIDPRTVMTIENQIPKLIVALMLITFSFAIAGLMIDIMWVGVYLVINIFGNLDPVLRSQIGPLTANVRDNPFNWVNNLNSGPFGFIGIAMQAAGGVKDILNVIAFNIFQNAGFLKVLFLSIVGLPVLISCFITNILNINIHLGPINIGSGQDIGACLDAGGATIISTVIGVVAFIIFAIAMLVAIGRLWWTLIKAYTLFLIFTIFGPFVIMSGIIPGWTKTNFEYWLRHIMAYTIVFPTAMGIFLLGKTLMDVYSVKATAAPPLLGVTGNALAFIGPLLGFAVLMLAPQALAMVQDALNAPDPKYLASVGQAIGVGSAAYGSSIGKVFTRGWRESDPLRGLDEGWMRKIALGSRNSWRRRIFYGSEIGKANPLGGKP